MDFRLPRRIVVVLVAALSVAAGLAAVAVPAVIGETVVRDGQNLHYRFTRLTADGLDTGWHIHPGLAVLQVQEGSLQVTVQGNCTPKTVAAGDTYVEAPFVPVRVVATGRVVFNVALYVPYEEAFTSRAASPCP
jgi:hypothetical protein